MYIFIHKFINHGGNFFVSYIFSIHQSKRACLLISWLKYAHGLQDSLSKPWIQYDNDPGMYNVLPCAEGSSIKYPNQVTPTK